MSLYGCFGRLLDAVEETPGLTPSKISNGVERSSRVAVGPVYDQVSHWRLRHLDGDWVAGVPECSAGDELPRQQRAKSGKDGSVQEGGVSGMPTWH